MNPPNTIKKLNSTYYSRAHLDFQDSDSASFGLIDGDDKLTNAGALLADYCPIYQSRLFCTRWNGLTKASGLQDALDDAEYVTFFFFVDALLIVLYRVSINLPIVIFIFNFSSVQIANLLLKIVDFSVKLCYNNCIQSIYRLL